MIDEDLHEYLTDQFTRRNAPWLRRPCDVCDHDLAIHMHARDGLDCAFGGCQCDRFTRRPRLFGRVLRWLCHRSEAWFEDQRERNNGQW